MKVRTVLSSTTLVTALSVSTLHAAAGSLVAHSHNGRSHSHSLPATGKNHTHGKKVASKAKKPSITHSHNGRSHTHILPTSGRNHTHGKKEAPKIKSVVDTNTKGWYFIGMGLNTRNVARYKLGSSKIVGGHATGVISWTSKNNTIEIEKYAIPPNDCKAGFGTAKIQTMAGALVSTDDFAFGANNLGSSVAKVICIANEL